MNQLLDQPLATPERAARRAADTREMEQRTAQTFLEIARDYHLGDPRPVDVRFPKVPDLHFDRDNMDTPDLSYHRASIDELRAASEPENAIPLLQAEDFLSAPLPEASRMTRFKQWLGRLVARPQTPKSYWNAYEKAQEHKVLPGYTMRDLARLSDMHAGRGNHVPRHRRAPKAQHKATARGRHAVRAQLA